ncbi:cytochrome c oxidase subunit 3 family protein [Parapusillimonas sp. SGNA-6]|nr:cytochrome c oxidase subunit 3 family protein [Parapusillimonas sp. SGNA-6]
MSAQAYESADGLADARARIGMWVFLASEIMFFGPVFFAYLYGRYEWPDAFFAASRSTNLLCGAVNTAVLLTSSAAVAVALHLAQAGLRQQARRALDAVMLLGLVFLLIKSYEYAQDWHEHLLPGPGFHLRDAANQAAAQLFYFIYFFATLLHGLHLVIGIGLVAYCHRRLDRDTGPRAVRRLEVAGLYWHFVDIIWIFLYPALYLAGRAS